MEEREEKQKQLVHSLARSLEEDGNRARMFETHISYVIVAGFHAYKIKKAVVFPFLDFSTLERRYFYCCEELRLNLRLAPHIYLDVVRLTGSTNHPQINGEGKTLEYAVRMQAFEQSALWTHRLSEKLLTDCEIDALADKLAGFHASTSQETNRTEWGTPELIDAQSRETTQTLAVIATEEGKAQLRAIDAWWDSRRDRLHGAFVKRKLSGMVRECHGDLHCANILTIDEHVEVFDCIEFSERLRWIDVMNDVAFICMDLQFHGREDLAARLFNRYLEITGDYEGVEVLQYYRVQRALVRAKVLLLSAEQEREDEKDACLKKGEAYLSLAASMTPSPRAALILMHGLSGSGKSRFARYLVEILKGIQIRSDVERKRLHGLTPTSREVAGLYDQSTTERTYERLFSLSRQLLAMGMNVIVDAAFLRANERQRFADLAKEMHVPFFIFDIQAALPVLERRINARAQEGSDASDADIGILHRQLTFAEPLSKREMGNVIVVDMDDRMNRTRASMLSKPVCDAIRHRG